MAKKFFDIIPPQFIKEVETKVKHIRGVKRGKKKNRKERKTSLRLKGILISTTALILLLAVFLYFKLASLTVIIWPKTEEVSFEEQIIASTSLQVVDTGNKKIPAQIIEEERELWQEFAATGSASKEGKAEGVIRVYNKYNPPTSFNLVAKTRFLSDSGKLFRSIDKINLPPAQIKNGKIVPSWVDVKVVAAEPGESYNIGPAKFSLPGLSGTASYYSIYGESTDSMEGGYSSIFKKVSADDIENAKTTLTQKLLSDVEANLKNKASSSDLIMLDNAVKKEVLETSSAVKAGTEVDKFNYKAKVRVRALVFKESDLGKLAKEYVLSQSPESKTIVENSLTLDYIPETVDLEAGKVTLAFNFSAEIYSGVKTKELAVLLRGKSSEQISDIIYSQLDQQISQLKINFWPFWVKSGPRNVEKIRIELRFD